MHKLLEERAIDLALEAPQFYIRRERQHELTNDGVTFKALVDLTMTLKMVADHVTPPAVLELFLVVVPIQGIFFVVTCGHERGSPNGQGDIGEVIRKCAFQITCMLERVFTPHCSAPQQHNYAAHARRRWRCIHMSANQRGNTS